MTIVARSRLLGLLFAVVALSLAGAASARASSLDDQDQAEAVLGAAGNGVLALNRLLLQIREAHLKMANYQNPKSPDPVSKAANALEINFADQLLHANSLVAKKLASAGNLITHDDEDQAFSQFMGTLTGIDNGLKNFQAFLGREDIIAARNKSWKHLEGVLDAWSAAHPGVDSDLIAQMHDLFDPQQIDDAVQSERSIISQVVGALNQAK